MSGSNGGDSARESITIAERFCGPPRSGNGGYVCGRFARLLDATATSVRLKAPPPIGRPLTIERDGAGARLLDGDALIAEARRPAFELEVPPPPSFASAERASSRFLGFADHNFPSCFVCGPAREVGDGLRIFPGPVEDPSAPISLLAAPWTPDPSLSDRDGSVLPEFVWSALDCPGAFTRYPLAPGIALVLGELAVAQVAPLRVGERCIVTAWALGDDGRRRHAGSALHLADGSLVARARATWIEVPAEVWR